MKARHITRCLAALGLIVSFQVHGADKIDFAKDIQPILQKRCVECHGEAKGKGKLRLHTKAEAFKGEEVIVAGKPDESELYARIILPKDDDDVMPNKGEPLTKEQQELIKAWIEQGAAWPEDLVIAGPVDPTKEKDPRKPIKPSKAEQAAIGKLKDLGVQLRPVAMNVTWTLANFRGVEADNVGKALALLKDVKTLEDLNLAGASLKDDDLKNLSSLENLTRIHLEKTGVTDAGLAHLKDLQYVKYLNLYKTGVTDAGLAHVKGMKNLKNVYLWQSKVSEKGAKDLQAALPKARVNMGWEMSALAKKIAEEKKKREEEEAKKKAEAEKKKKEEEAKKKAEAEKKKKEEEAKKKAEAEKKKKEEEAKKKAEAEKKKDN